MSFFSFIIVSLLIVTGCTKKSTEKASQDQTLNYKSKISYVYDSQLGLDAAAMLEGEVISWSQLLSQDVALQELQTSYQNKALATAYGWAAQLDSSQEPKTLVVFMEAPEDLKEVLAKADVNFMKDLTVDFQQPTEASVLAQVGDKKLLWMDFHRSNIQHAQLYERLFQQRMQRLNGVVIRRLLLQASKNADLAMEAFVKKNIMSEPIDPTEQDVRDFAQQKGISESDLDENMIERLKAIVKQNHRDAKIENYVAKELVKKPIRVAFPGPKVSVEAPRLSENDQFPQWGKGQGPELIFVGDWSCENCGSTLTSFLEVKNSFGEKIQGAFIYSFPDRDREARMAAEAAMCVEAQNGESFWTFLQKLGDVKEENLEEKINIAAQGSGVDYEVFRDCFLKREHEETVNGHLVYVQNLGVTSPPLVILQGNVLEDTTTAGIKKQINDLGYSVKSSKGGILARIKAFFGF